MMCCGVCRGKVSELEEAEQHMTEATARFNQVMSSEDAAEAQNVPDIYLEPIRDGDWKRGTVFRIRM